MDERSAEVTKGVIRGQPPMEKCYSGLRRSIFLKSDWRPMLWKVPGGWSLEQALCRQQCCLEWLGEDQFEKDGVWL